MTEIIPSINHADPDEMRRRIRLVEPHVQWVHVDVSDGIFSSLKVFNDPSALFGFKTPVGIELHLMIDKPEEHLDDWIKTGAERFLVHIESTGQFRLISQKLKSASLETGLALRPETPIEAYDEYTDIAPYVLILGVEPGPSGQRMQPHIVDKVLHLRQKHTSCTIEVDGGVSLALGTAEKAAKAGANALCAGYDIFSSKDISRTIAEYRRL